MLSRIQIARLAAVRCTEDKTGTGVLLQVYWNSVMRGFSRMRGSPAERVLSHRNRYRSWVKIAWQLGLYKIFVSLSEQFPSSVRNLILPAPRERNNCSQVHSFERCIHQLDLLKLRRAKGIFRGSQGYLPPDLYRISS